MERLPSVGHFGTTKIVPDRYRNLSTPLVTSYDRGANYTLELTEIIPTPATVVETHFFIQGQQGYATF